MFPYSFPLPSMDTVPCVSLRFVVVFRAHCIRLQRQTRFLARLPLFLVAVPSGARHQACARSLMQCSVARQVATLMRTGGSPPPSNVAPAAGRGTPNAACSFASAACSTSAAVFGLSSSVPVGFAGLATLRRYGSCRALYHHLWISNSGPSEVHIAT